MTVYYQTNTWNGQPQYDENQIKIWKHISEKKNWRIDQLPNRLYPREYQELKNEDKRTDVTRRATLEGADEAIDKTVEHYKKKVEFNKETKVVKNFK